MKKTAVSTFFHAVKMPFMQKGQIKDFGEFCRDQLRQLQGPLEVDGVFPKTVGFPNNYGFSY